MNELEKAQAQLRKLFDEYGLSYYVNRALAVARPSIQMQLDHVTNDASIPLGATKFGGMPDFPPGFAWPAWIDPDPASFWRDDLPELREQRPLAFVLQVDLAEVAALNWLVLPLPRSGLLTFFYDAIMQPWGYEPEHRGSWLVVWHAEGTPLVRCPPPDELPDDVRFPTSRVALTCKLTLPTYHWEWLNPDEKMSAEQFGSLQEIKQALHGPIDVNEHRIGGYPDLVQRDMELECEMVSSGRSWGEAEINETPEDIVAAKEWRLLLQVDSDMREIKPEMDWSTGGILYLWMRNSDIADRAFDKSWVVLQTT